MTKMLQLRRGKFMCERNSLDAAEVVWKDRRLAGDLGLPWVYRSSVQKGDHLNREASNIINIAEVKSSNIMKSSERIWR